ncbi:MAG: alginate export family protein [Gammaproteobacteria bacterium]|nr:alginate export family protein [Gammaproteobacteria bacterium]
MHRFTTLSIAIRGLLLTGASLCTLPAFAGYDVISSDETRLTFNLDAVAASFQGEDSWFGESKSFNGEPTNSWGEFGVEPRLTLETGLGGGTLFGQLSTVYTATHSDDASGLTIGTGDSEDLNLEQSHVGWKTGQWLDGYTTSFSMGRQDYQIGSGMLIADGTSDGGGEYGGWYIDMRKAFIETGIARIEGKGLLLEGFRIEYRPRRGGTRAHADGGNAEYTFFETTRLGATYLVVDAQIPGVDDLQVWDGRLDWNGKGALEGFGLRGEYAHEDSKQIEADGWFAEASYQAKELCWTPTFSYRYAHFDGDDPATAKDEQFQEIAYGFDDYGTWFQGEITGNYPLANGNLDSHRLRVKLQPGARVTLNVMYYDFTLDQEQIRGDPVRSDDWGQEIDFTVDWAVTDSVAVIGVLGNLMPGDAAKQWTGGDKDWLYSMIYVSYGY